MNRADIAALESGTVEAALRDADFGSPWKRLTASAGGHAASLLQTVCRLAPPERIAELGRLEREQEERGAGFYGTLPGQIPDTIKPPVDLAASLQVAAQIAEIRTANLAALADTMPQYPVSFRNEAWTWKSLASPSSGWQLTLDVDGLRAVLDAFDAGVLDEERAQEIARMPAFSEMLRHRRDLGYVPDPLIDEDGLAWCLEHAASRDPVDCLWKFLHPQNLFDLSDVYTHRAEYRRLLDDLGRDGQLVQWILGQIAPYTPPHIIFRDRLTFAVGWGIRGWATSATAGMNIEHAKDDFDRLLPTLVHETYHRLQTQIAFPNPETTEVGFDRITSYPLESGSDRHLYQALCYIMLEGSATYVAASEVQRTWTQDVEPGLALLDRIADALGDEETDVLLNEGLRSDGPFYGLGALLSDAIVQDAGPAALGIALQRGAPAFVERGLCLMSAPSPRAAEIAGLRARVCETG